nr:hypothetical protein [Tanacetum cinerariifolium]
MLPQSTNNHNNMNFYNKTQLRNLSNPRQEATVNDGRVTLQTIQGRKISFATDTTRTYTPGASGNSGIAKGQAILTVIAHNTAYQADDLYAYDFDYDELNNAKVALMENFTQKFVDESSELRAISGHMLGAAGVQIPENNLDDLSENI